MILSTPHFMEPPADGPAASAVPSLAEVLLAGFYARYPALVRLLAAERGLEVRLTDPDLVRARLYAEEDAYWLSLLEDLEEGEEDEGEQEGEDGPRGKRERDPWRGYVQISPPDREILAKCEWPFRVKGVRRWRELSGGTRWHLLIEQAPLNTLGVLRLPVGNAQRDRQLQWLVDQHAAGLNLDLVLCLHLEPAGPHKHRLALKRRSWWDGPEAWAYLPDFVRKAFRDRLEGA